MEALLPPDAALPLAEQRLLQARETAQNRQLLLLVGAARPLPLAERIRDDGLASGLFAAAELQRAPSLETLREAYRDASYRVLPSVARQQLRDDPAAYFRARTDALLNPFAVAVLPPDADWPGFSRYFPSPLTAAWQPDADGLLSRTFDGKRWLLLVLSAFVFGSLHGLPVHYDFLLYFAMGLVLGAAYLRTKDLKYPILIHMVNNALGLAGMLFE